MTDQTPEAPEPMSELDQLKAQLARANKIIESLAQQIGQAAIGRAMETAMRDTQ